MVVLFFTHVLNRSQVLAQGSWSIRVQQDKPESLSQPAPSPGSKCTWSMTVWSRGIELQLDTVNNKARLDLANEITGCDWL